MRKAQASAQERGYDAAYHRLRRRLLKAHPVCVYCGQRPAREIHHSPSLAEAPHRRLDPTACFPACTPCHRERTNQQNQERHETNRGAPSWRYEQAQPRAEGRLGPPGSYRPGTRRVWEGAISLGSDYSEPAVVISQDGSFRYERGRRTRQDERDDDE